ncbi:MAG: 30S ribosomal protein S16 [Candidatus Shapirobacteria bacterium]|jgi:small subunit ribosomal protein S16
MLKIKLFPQGKKHQRSFRIVVASDRSKHNGIYLDNLGFYTPGTQEIKIDQDKLKKWTTNGAQITEGVAKIIALVK